MPNRQEFKMSRAGIRLQWVRRIGGHAHGKEKNTYRDVKMVYEWVVANVTRHESNVVLYGQSVGSGPSCYLASRRGNVGGLVLHSPFTSGMRVLTPSRALACLDIFPNIDRIKKVRAHLML